ncbi:hypothetical protein AAMO2058_000590800 [Amorphochlora amoebiformis]|uniref:Signal recognition particle SRP54 subunit M-domain domain-containing protein n=1 Tax=Amorphochlora amoebiformis TaxID=1561963 RepID=A0A7S0DQ68_9EUKA|mmetsp:Transcript_4878/g.7440  ORF Transcript_4878/g.7440 Transcript_4878/m.7440 type:complete len:228 (+) Transcript_4878:22-705(+)
MALNLVSCVRLSALRGGIKGLSGYRRVVFGGEKIIPNRWKVFDVQKRRFSVMNMIMGEAQVQKSKEKFKEQLLTMLQLKRLRLKDLKEILAKSSKEAGVEGWRKNLPGFMKPSEDEVEGLKTQLRIMDAFSTRELSLAKEASEFKHADKTRICREAGVSAEEVNKLLLQWDSMQMMHGWLKRRQARGLDLPQSEKEMQGMMMVDKPKMPQKLKQKMKKLSRHGTRES